MSLSDYVISFLLYVTALLGVLGLFKVTILEWVAIMFLGMCFDMLAVVKDWSEKK